MTGEAASLGCLTVPLIYKATLLSLRDIAAQPNRSKHREVVKMQRQRTRSQIKEQKESPKKELNKMEASKLPDIEFKTKVMRMLKELSENFNSMKKDIETIKKKKNQSAIKNT